MIHGDEFLKQFLAYNFDWLVLVYCFLVSLFPNNRILRSLRDAFDSWRERKAKADKPEVIKKEY